MLASLSGAGRSRQDLSEGEQATRDALKYLSEMENHWDHLIYRVAKSPADVEDLMSSTFQIAAIFITHRMIGN